MVDISYLNAVVEDDTPTESADSIDARKSGSDFGDRVRRRSSCSTRGSGRFITSRIKDKVDAAPELKEED